WWSRDALTDVLTADHDEWHAWLRIGPDGRGGELFAFAWPGTANQRVGEALDRAIDAQRSGALSGTGHVGDNVRGGWALYRSLAAADDLTEHADYGNSTTVDDWTEDFDTPQDW